MKYVHACDLVPFLGRDKYEKGCSDISFSNQYKQRCVHKGVTENYLLGDLEGWVGSNESADSKNRINGAFT